MIFEEELRKSGRLIYTNKGCSMLPLLREDRDVMVIEACKPEEVKRLDAVLFTRKSDAATAYVLHRVVKCNADGSFFVAGDNCTGGEIVEGSQILGRLTAVIRDGKRREMSKLSYRLYAHIWGDAYPVRFRLLRLRNFIKRFLRYAKRKLHRVK